MSSPSLTLVHYRLNAADAEKVNATRTSHSGNSAYAGEVVPFLITAVHFPVTAKFDGDPEASEGTVNGQAFLDGNYHHLWIQNVKEGEEEGQWGRGQYAPSAPVPVKTQAENEAEQNAATAEEVVAEEDVHVPSKRKH
jgi:hypothetical protein